MRYTSALVTDWFKPNTSWSVAGLGYSVHSTVERESVASVAQDNRPSMSNSFKCAQITSWLTMSMLPNVPGQSWSPPLTL